MIDVDVIWKPLKGSQSLALDTRANHTLFDGTRGPGKTTTQLMRFRRRVGLGYGPYWRGIIFDREYKDLADIVAQSERFFPRFEDGAKFLRSAVDYKWVWPTGEELLFRHVKKLSDYDTFHGHEYPFIGWNELTKQPTSELYDMMMSVNRSSFTPLEHTPKNLDGSYATIDGKILPPIPLEVFSTTNPNGCVPYGEVLTSDRGWIDIKDIQVGDNVVSCDSLGRFKIGEVSHIINADYKGKLVSRVGRGLNMVFTPNHRLAHLNTNKTIHTVKEYYKLPGQAYVRRTAYDWIGEDVKTIKGFDAGDFMELLGWFISEGCMIYRPNDCEKYSFQIAQSKEETRKLIEALLIRMNVQYRKDKQCFVITHPILAMVFSEQGYCRQKHIPRKYLDLSFNLLTRLHESLMLGDGCENIYYTSSKQLADDVSELCTKLGMSVYVSSRQRENRDGLAYAVNQSFSDYTVLNTDNYIYNVSSKRSQVNIDSTEFEGKVYCLTVPDTETFFIRQNGCVWLSGNSGHNWVKFRFIDVAKPGQIVRKSIRVFNPRTREEEDAVITQVRIFGSYKENPYLDPKYIAFLASIKDENLKKSWLNGDWSVISGGALNDVWKDSVHKIPVFSIPKNWIIDRSFDWGSTHPFSVGWWAEANGEEVRLRDGSYWCPQPGSLIQFNEYYGTEEIGTNRGLKLSAKTIAQGIRNKEIAMLESGMIKSQPFAGPADNQIRDVRESDVETIEKKMEDEGICWTRSDKSPGSRKNGLQVMRDMFENAIKGEGPGLYFTTNCPASLATIPMLPRDPDNLDDVDTTAEDHPYDMARYRCLAGSNRIATSLNIQFPR